MCTRKAFRWARAAAAVGVLAAAFTSPGAASAASGSSARTPSHIFYIMMENHWYSQIIGNQRDAPFINRLAGRGNLETSYYGVTHPSMPNYLAAISGSFQGVWDDCAAGATVTCPPEEFVPGSGDGTAGHYLTQAQITSASATPHLFPGANLVDQLESHHLTWRAYMQSIPSVGSRVEYAPTVQTPNGPVTVELYAQKHDPFMYFRDINHPGSRRLRQIVPFAHRFAHDLRTGNVPNFVWISPDQCHDMHGTDPASAKLVGFPKCGYPNSGLDHGAIQLGDRFLRGAVGTITHSRLWRTTNSSIIITWDENDYSGFKGTPTSPRGRNGVILGGGHVALIVLNSHGGGNRTVSTFANHYNLLATIEHEWHLGCLAAACGIGRSQLLTPLFNR
jgi:phosphatidylinositol-3-phosphatase